MKHLTVVLLVMLAAGGGNAARLCEMFCASPETTAHHCSQHSSDAAVMGPADCVKVATQPPLVVRELRPHDSAASDGVRTIWADAAITQSAILLHSPFAGRFVVPGHCPPTAPLRI